MPISRSARILIAEGGKARCAIVRDPNATAAERRAAEELATWLGKVTGAAFEVQALARAPLAPAIVVGQGAAARACFPSVDLARLGAEELVMKTGGGRLLLAGGRPRGTLYAVYRFLQDRIGVRWYTPWCERIPRISDLSIGPLSVRSRPAFEYRDPFWFPAFDGDWAARNGSNSQTARLTEAHGGRVEYKGFVHTYYALVPPEVHFREHPEWFSLANGKRVGERAQICTTDPEVRALIVRRVREWLRESPGASIVSVSQNDHAGACECRRCADIDAREGSHAGSVLDLANHVAREIEAEYPHVAVDTLAYQYTRKAPRRLRPRHNVIVRLCSIECNFARPLTDRTNASFARDLRDWSRLTRRLYVWDYTTDFSHYLLPFPNWHHLGANVRFYHRNGVRGLFEQGAYQSHSCEMSELRPWVLAQLLWNPYQDDRKLIREFLEAYYGAAAPHIERWFRLIERAAKPYYVGIGHPDASPFLRFATLAECERIWREAEAAVAADPDRLWRVRQARLIPRYLWLSQWVGLQRECRQEGAIWPVEQLRAGAAAAWLSVVTGQGPAGWAPMTTMRESGQAPAAFVASLGPDPDEAESRPAKRLASVPVGDLVAPASRWHREVYVQDDRAIVFREPVCARPMEDAGASDGVVIRMVAGAEGARGAIEIHGADLPKAVRPGRYELYYEVRADVAPGAPASAEAFQMRVHDPIAGLYTADRIVSVGELKPGYARYLAGIVGIHQYVRIWMGHARAPAVRSVLFDRLILVRER